MTSRQRLARALVSSRGLIILSVGLWLLYTALAFGALADQWPLSPEAATRPLAGPLAQAAVLCAFGAIAAFLASLIRGAILLVRLALRR